MSTFSLVKIKIVLYHI